MKDKTIFNEGLAEVLGILIGLIGLALALWIFVQVGIHLWP